jgi:hypothetical protein
MNTATTRGWRLTLAGLGIFPALGFPGKWRLSKKGKRPLRQRIRERIAFAKAQPLDIYLGTRHW